MFKWQKVGLSTVAGLMLMVCIHGVSQGQAAEDKSGTDSPLISQGPKPRRGLPPLPPGAAPPSTDPRDFEGIWLADGNPTAVGGPPGFETLPPYTPATAKRQEAVADMIKKGAPPAEAAARCRPSTLFRIGFDIYPAEIVQSSDKVVILGEEGRIRWQIFLNRSHPKTVTPTFFGDSVGHWQGDTLVVDTVGLNGKIGVLSTQAHVIAKIRKINGGRQLETQLIIEDPVNFTKPYEQTLTTSWRPDLQMLEYQCEENMEGARDGLLFEK